MLDDFNREGLGIEVDFSLPAERVVRSLNQIIEWRGKPLAIRVDNGAEYISSTLMIWAEKQGIALNHIQPGQSSGKQSTGLFSDPPHTQQNAYVERYNRTVRNEWLDLYIFETIEPYSDCGQSPTCQWEAQEIATDWLWTYNNERPSANCVAIGPRPMSAGIGGITPARDN